ncbi:hypothetical protein [Acidocella facilis]|uniref:hypothetical protein n=1 Tax=Acidocella facilis TaxID=525 RepID=UPI00047CBD20|nr:hypothetical protein [Acidocella facilis]
MTDGTERFTFGPYLSAAMARHHLRMFQSLAFPGQGSEAWGIVWSENGQACVLQPPTYDKDGDALALAYEWTGAVPLHPKPQYDKTPARSVKTILEEFYTNSVQNLKTFAVTHVVNPVISSVNAVHNVIVDHPIAFDTMNTALDAYGTISGFLDGLVLFGVGGATSATGVGVPLGAAEIAAGATGFAASGASFNLLVADGRHLWFEVFSDDKAVKRWEGTEYYKNTERIAPLVAIIDPLREGTKALGAMRELRPLSTETAAATKLAANTTAAATEATDAAARIDNLAGNAQKILDPNSNALAQIKQQQVLRQANAAAAAARAKEAAADLARLQKKADELQKEVSDYFTLKVHFKEATLTRDAALNGWSMGNYAFNNPFSEHFGEHIGNQTKAGPLQALVPAGLSGAEMLGFMHHIYAAVIAVGGGKAKPH